jgi:hypothetical protein
MPETDDDQISEKKQKLSQIKKNQKPNPKPEKVKEEKKSKTEVSKPKKETKQIRNKEVKAQMDFIIKRRFLQYHQIC